MHYAWLLAVVGCSAPSTRSTIANAHTPERTGIPCGVETVHDLDPFDAPRCANDGSCLPGARRHTVGACTVEMSTASDLDGGRRRVTIVESGRPLVSSDSYQRRVIYDARVPTPSGLRVGMTGADFERAIAQTTGEIECMFDEAAWRGRWWCKLRRHSECGAEDANWIHVIFAGARGPAVKGDLATALVRTLRIVAIDLGPDCGES